MSFARASAYGNPMNPGGVDQVAHFGAMRALVYAVLGGERRDHGRNDALNQGTVHKFSWTECLAMARLATTTCFANFSIVSPWRRTAGPEMLMAATTPCNTSVTGAATQHTPGSFSSWSRE